MSNIFLTTEKIANEVYFHKFIDRKFKTNTIYLDFVVKFTPETVSGNELVVRLLRNSVGHLHSFKSFEIKLQNLYGADLSVGCGILGDNHIVTLIISVLDDEFALNGEELLKRATELLFDVVFKPNVKNGEFFQPDIEKEKENLKTLIKGEYDNKERFVFKKAKELLFGKAGCGCGRYGTLESVAAPNGKDLFSVYKNLICFSQVHIFLIGRRDSNFCKDVFINSFKSFNRHNVYGFSNEKYLAVSKPKCGLICDDVAQAKLVLGFAAEKSSLFEKFNDDVISIMTIIFGGAPFSKLFLNVRERLSLCYYCSAVYDRFKGVIWVTSGVDGKNIEKAKAAIIEQLKLMQCCEFSDDDLKKAKSWVKTQLETVKDEASHIVDYFYSEFNSFGVGKIRNYKQRLTEVLNIGKEEIAEAAKYFKLQVECILKKDGNLKDDSV